MITQAQIQEFAHRLAERYRPERIILFGSQADGTANEDSDVDLLVVMKHSERKNIYKSVEILNALDPSFPIDLLVRTPDHVRIAIDRGDPIVNEILNYGRSLGNHKESAGCGL
jgi:uncharacterized protein